MVELSTENKALCFEDSTPKPLYIFLYVWVDDEEYIDGGYYKFFKIIDNDDIILESASIDEGVLEGNYFNLGSFVAPKMKLKCYNDGLSHKDMLAVPVQKIGSQYIAYFDGYISSEEVVENGKAIELEISSFLSQRLDVDVLPNLKAWSGENFSTMTYFALADGAAITSNIGPEDPIVFENQKKIIQLNQSTLPDKLTVEELIKQAGEFLGANVILKEKRVVDFEEMKSYEPFHGAHINFIRLGRVDTVAQSNIKPLPSGYEPAPYVHFSGEQYINTGIVPTATTNAEYAVYIQEYKDYGPHILATENFYFPYIRKFSGVVGVTWNRRGNYSSSDVDKVGYSKLFKAKAFFNDSVEFNNVAITGITSGTQTTTLPLYLGTYGGEPNNTEITLVGDVYSCKIYDGYTVVRDFVPAIRTSDNKVGFYDFANSKFYTNNGNGDFTTPNSINAYKLPYYISLYNDKTKRIKIDSLNVVTQTGEQKQYKSYWKTPIYTTYEIRNNIFFEALSTQSVDECWSAIENVRPYIEQQNLYRCDLQCVYPPFIEGGDYLIVNNNKHQSKLPIGYLAVESIEISQGSFLDTEIIPNSNDVQVDFTFSHFGNIPNQNILRSDGREDLYNTFNISMLYNQLIAEIGYYGGSVQINAFEIPFVPPEQKINLVIECKGNQYSYSGTFQGNGKLYWEVGNTHRTIEIGDGIKIYHFSYSQNGEKLCDFYPCVRESDQKIGMYDTVNNYFTFPYSEYGTPNIKYESSDIIIPALSINSQGINSMKSNVRCTATNAK